MKSTTVIAMTNGSSTACSLDGYPSLQAIGHPNPTSESSRAHQLPLLVSRGDVPDCPDPGAHVLHLEPGRTAYFAVGTFTGYDAPLSQIATLLVSPPATHTASALLIDTTIYLNGPARSRLPVEVTAFRATPWGWTRRIPHR